MTLIVLVLFKFIRKSEEKYKKQNLKEKLLKQQIINENKKHIKLQEQLKRLNEKR